jgi:Raf kinase inhibitor-like YbhB/YbcL family protein
MHDPDVARAKSTTDMLHWLIFNIPGDDRSLPEGVPAADRLPDGAIQSKNGGETVGFRGPGARGPGPYHHYTFELYALDTALPLGPDATRAQVLAAMEGHVLAKAATEGRFHR